MTSMSDEEEDWPDWLPRVPYIDPSIEGAQQILEWMATLGLKVDGILTGAGSAHGAINKRIDDEAAAQAAADQQIASAIAASTATANAAAAAARAAADRAVALEGKKIRSATALAQIPAISRGASVTRDVAWNLPAAPDAVLVLPPSTLLGSVTASVTASSKTGATVKITASLAVTLSTNYIIVIGLVWA